MPGQHATPSIFLYFGLQVEFFRDLLAGSGPTAALLAVLRLPRHARRGPGVPRRRRPGSSGRSSRPPSDLPGMTSSGRRWPSRAESGPSCRSPSREQQSARGWRPRAQCGHFWSSPRSHLARGLFISLYSVTLTHGDSRRLGKPGRANCGQNTAEEPRFMSISGPGIFAYRNQNAKDRAKTISSETLTIRTAIPRGIRTVIEEHDGPVAAVRCESMDLSGSWRSRGQ